MLAFLFCTSLDVRNIINIYQYIIDLTVDAPKI
jgi:hypothetical protein